MNKGAKVRKLRVGGCRIQRCDGGEVMMDFVQSPALEMMILAVVRSTGIVAKACHSVKGAVEVRIVLVYGMFVKGKVTCTSLVETSCVVMGTRLMRSQGMIMRTVVIASIQSEGYAYNGIDASGVRVVMPLWIQRTSNAAQPPTRCVISNVLWQRTRNRGIAVMQTSRMANKAAYAVTMST